MERQRQPPMGGGQASPPGERCPICGKPVPADQFGFVECRCGWGGPGDPVESARGASRWWTLLDRRLAAGIARRELARIARTKVAAGRRNLLYIALLSVLSALIYLIVGALFVGAVVLCAQFLLAQQWVGATLTAVIVLYLFWALFGVPQRIEGIVAPIAGYPRLAGLTKEVAVRVGVKPPKWVVLSPDATFSIARRML